MNELPEPLTPTDCDLRDFQFMPLDVVRLRDSDIAVMVSGEEFRSAVMLWCAAWHQVPAGSLPNDDRSLASLAGYGRAVGEWLKVKEGALRGWIECADARLYHPVVCEKARESWDSKLQHAYDKLVDRLRKLNKRREESGLPVVVCPPFDVWKSIGRPLESKLISTGNDDSFQRKGGDVPPDGQRNDIGRAGPDDSDSGGFGDGDAAQSAHSINSGGSEDVSAGNAGAFQRNAPQIPPEKALKGQVREGTGKGEVKTIPTPQSPEDPARDPVDPPRAAVEVSMSLIAWERARGKVPRGIFAGDAKVQELAAMAPTPAELRKAYDLAVADRDATGDATPINAGFVLAMLAKVRNPPKPRAKQLTTMTNDELMAEAARIGAHTHGYGREQVIASIQAKRKQLEGVAA